MTKGRATIQSPPFLRLWHSMEKSLAILSFKEVMRRIDGTSDKDQMSTARGNFLELLHPRCKDIPWLEETLNTQLQNHAQWTSPIIQNELLHFFADLIIELISVISSSSLACVF